MTVEQLREVVNTQPFTPFTLQLADGNEVAVPHREFLWIHPKNPRTVGVALENSAFKIIDLLLVAAIPKG